MVYELTGETENELVYVVVLDCGACRLGLLDEDVATTLIAVASEDPADWIEMLAYWPRYTSRVVPEFLSSIPLEIVARENLPESIGNSQLWIVLDLEQKRFLSGKAFQPIGRDACFAMHTDENGDQHDPLSVHLPPWWELAEQVEFDAIDKSRQTSLKLPVVDREFLFGSPMVQAIADQVLNVASAGRLKEAIKNSEPDARNPFYSLTIEVHRDWLMTPREDLGGLYPRQMFHGGVDWIDKLAWGQRLRFDQGGGQIVAAPKDSFGYKQGPFGREEMAIYFDLCRELIEAGWHWCQHNFVALSERPEGPVKAQDSAPTVGLSDAPRESLIGFLIEVKLDWLTSPFEGGSAPAFILECSRRRVPRGAGVEIVGMDGRQAEQHVIDCDCPICNMMAEGKMGVGFCGIDGHHLELDNEFAFSMHETREAWEEEQREWAEQSARWERERKEREYQAAEGATEQDEFSSAWSGSVSDQPIPGDTGGNLKLAFLLAEVVTEMKQGSGQEDQTSDDLTSDELTPTDLASDKLVKQLNADFSKFRTSNHDELAANTKSLTNTLERIAEAHPSLISRIADFQSRIAESARRPIPAPESFMDERWDDDDIPF